jgi:hypothetical protein
MRTETVITWRSRARRRITALLTFWMLWAVLIGVANGLGAIDATLGFDIAH